jgi:hypothetical protein
MARTNHRSGSYPMQVSNAGSLGWPSVMPYGRGMQPPPQNPRKLKHECTRLAWALHILQNERSKLVTLCERKTAQVIALRRQHDAYACALQDADPVLYAEVEAQKREWDDPIKALQWASRREFGGDNA